MLLAISLRKMYLVVLEHAALGGTLLCLRGSSVAVALHLTDDLTGGLLLGSLMITDLLVQEVRHGKGLSERVSVFATRFERRDGHLRIVGISDIDLYTDSIVQKQAASRHLNPCAPSGSKKIVRCSIIVPAHLPADQILVCAAPSLVTTRRNILVSRLGQALAPPPHDPPPRIHRRLVA